MSLSRAKVATVWVIALSGIGALVAAGFLAPIDGETGPGIVRFLGRFHPLVLHFPIAFLLLAVLLEASRFSRRTAYLARFSAPVLLIAAITAFATVTLGLMLASGEGHQGELIDKHRWGGIVVASLVAFAFAVRITLGQVRRAPLGWAAYSGVLLAALGSLMITAHAGGSLVHGPGYLAEFAPPQLAWLLAENDPVSGATATESGSSPISPTTLKTYKSNIGPLFSQYCAKCHGDGKQEANFRVDSLVVGMTNSREVHDWSRVMNVLNSHQMPPEDGRPLPDEERVKIVGWIETALKEEARSRRANNITSQTRRLSKREFNHTYQDLFRVPAKFSTKLPADPRSEKGYDTDASLLRVSELDLRVYMELARGAVDRYVTFGPVTNEAELYFQEFEDNYYFGRWRAHHLTIERAPRPLPLDEFERRVAAHRASPPVYDDQFLGAIPYGRLTFGGEDGAAELRGYPRRHETFVYIPTRKTVGEMVIRVYAAATPAARDGTFPRMRLEVGEAYDRNLLSLNVGEHDVTALKDEPGVYEFRFRLEDTRSPPNATRGGGPGNFDRPLLLVFSNVTPHEDGVLGTSRFAQEDPRLPDGIRVNGKLPGNTDEVIEGDRIATEQLLAKQPSLLHLDALEITITPVASEPEVGWKIAHAGEGASLDDERRIVRDTLEQFMPIAFRRPVTDDEILRHLETFSLLRENEEPYELSVREALASVLISPEFLFIGDLAPTTLLADVENPEDVQRSIALASRLSYFIWSSAPDERLRALAATGKLVDPAVLAQETARLLEDDRSHRFSDGFVRQWLKLDDLTAATVSTDHYPTYGPELGKIMVQQTVATFQDVFHNNRDARTLFTDDHMFLNDQLARHYGLPLIEGGDLRRFPVEQDLNRSGLIGQASILAINSNGIDSHPVKRGVWLLERILDDPPPSPPPNVPSLGADGKSLIGLTLREQIEGHRDKSACISCHQKIDPWGLALENFDATGAWRDTVTTGEGESVKVVAVDAHTILPDGFEIQGVGDLGDYLLRDRERDVMRGLVRHMMTYGLGRELDILDEQEAERITAMFRTSGYSLKHLVLAIVQSDSFVPGKVEVRHG